MKLNHSLPISHRYLGKLNKTMHIKNLTMHIAYSIFSIKGIFFFTHFHFADDNN